MVVNEKEEGVKEETKVEKKPKWILKNVLNFEMLEKNGIHYEDFVNLKQGQGDYDLVVKFLNIVLEGPEVTKKTNLLDPDLLKITEEMGFLG